LVITDDQGYLDRAENHPYVGWVGSSDASFSDVKASGVLINPNWVLTAGHVAAHSSTLQVFGALSFGLGSNYKTNPGETMFASEVFLHPNYTGSSYDLALLYFDNPFTSASPVSLYGDTVVAGMDSDIVGYGVYQEVNGSIQTNTGDRRAGNNVISGDDIFYENGVITRLRASSTSSTYRPLGMAGRTGDSGGGLIIGGELAGITKWSGLSNYDGTITGYSLIDHDWVNATIASRPSSIPEPSGLLLLCAGAVAFVFNRRRRTTTSQRAKAEQITRVVTLARLMSCFFAACILFSQNASAGLVIADDQLYLDRADNYPEVGWFEGTNPDGSFAHGSGVLIKPNWVLTAAHVAVNGQTLTPRTNQNFGLGSNFITDRGESMSVSDFYIHPTYAGGDNGRDLALLYFENPFVSATPTSLFLGSVATGLDSDIVGFGQYQNINDSNPITTGDRRAGNNVIVGPDLVLPLNVVTRLRASNSQTYRELGMGGLPGDSGGGLFVDGELAGITKAGSALVEYNYRTSYTLLDQDWINTTIASHSSSIPEPSGLLLLCAGSFAIVLNRRRRTITCQRANGKQLSRNAGTARLISCVFAACLLCSQSADAGLVITDDQGYLDRAQNYPNVGHIERFNSTTGLFEFGGSGVLIDSHWVITAAHVAVNSTTLVPRESLGFGLGSNYLTNPGEKFSAADLYVYPTYQGGNTGYDLALLYFVSPFVSATPANIFQGDVVAGLDSDIVGFGEYRNVEDSVSIITGDRRAGNNLILGPDSDLPGTNVRTRLDGNRPLEMGGLPGDSGGGLFINGELAGITKSAGVYLGLGQSTSYTLLDKDWINTTIASRSSSIPEPSGLLLLCAGAFALVFNSRRRTTTSLRANAEPISRVAKLARLVSCVFAACLLCSQSANAGLVITDDQGYLDRAENHPYVGWVGSSDPSFFDVRASGVLINPHWVLTAGHVAANSSTLQLFDSLEFGLGSNYKTNPGESMSASEVFLHPTYAGGDTGYDLALMYFENPFTTVIPANLYDGDIVAGMDSDIVGYGVYQEVDSSIQTNTGDRRAGNNVIANVGSLGAQYVLTYLRPSNFSTYRPLGMGGTRGDSGGGLFIDGELAGINKAASLSVSYGRGTSYTLLDRDWINATIASHSSSIPEPSSFTILLLTCPFLLSRRKRPTLA